MIDKLSFTIFAVPNREYLASHGKLIEDTNRSRIYKYMYQLDKALVFVEPHKFSEGINAKIPFTKIDVNPKNFDCYEHMFSYLLSLFDDPSIRAEDFGITRIDIAVDIEGFPIDSLLGMLRIKRIRSDSLSFFKGTIYAGSDPKMRIYDKIKEIKARFKKGMGITEYERGLLDSGKSYTRFEIEIRGKKITLQELAQDPFRFAEYFNRLEVFDFGDNEGSGVLHVLYKYVNRKYRKDLERYKDHRLVEDLKERFRSSVGEWFSEKEPF
jgi:hypothetical protein